MPQGRGRDGRAGGNARAADGAQSRTAVYCGVCYVRQKPHKRALLPPEGLELSNNAAERCAKFYAIGRKNSLFHTSAAGAESSALVYSMIETAKANRLNVFQYLYTLLLYMPSQKDNPDAVAMLLPWSDFIKEHCMGLIDVETITPENKPSLPL